MSDPSGSVRFEIPDSGALERYRFGLRTAEYLICARCGVYVAAVLSSSRGRFATLNVNAMSPPPMDLPDAQPVSYEHETQVQRIARRERRWTPVTGAV